MDKKIMEWEKMWPPTQHTTERFDNISRSLCTLGAAQKGEKVKRYHALWLYVPSLFTFYADAQHDCFAELKRGRKGFGE